MFESWNLLEIIWTIVAATGVTYSWLNVRNGKEDLKLLPFITDEAPRIVAKGNIRRDRLRLIIQLTYVALGIWGGLVPEPLHRTPVQIVTLLLFSGVLTITSLLLTISARYDHRDRVLLLDKLWFKSKIK